MKRFFQTSYGWIPVLAILIALGALTERFPWRIDLTAEKRYSLGDPVKKLLARLPDDVTIDVFLQGNLKSGIRRLKNSTDDLLGEFKDYAHGRVHYRFVDPLANMDDSAKAFMMDSLAHMGIQPMTQVAQSKQGEESQRIVIPAAIIRYKDHVFPVDLLKGVQRAREGQPEEQLYVNAETLLEYKFASGIEKLVRDTLPAIGYVIGNGEPMDFRVYDLIQYLRTNFRFGVIRLDSVPVVPNTLDALVIVKPVTRFTDEEKFKLDQYVMHGGNMLWMIDNLNAEPDSLSMEKEVVAYDRGLNLEDILFRYGARINQDLVEDMQCASLNLVVGSQGGKPQIQLLPWPYYPLLDGTPFSPVTRNLDPVYARFANSVDTVKAPGISKTVLLQSSPHARTVSTPALISFESIKTASDPKAFNRQAVPVSVLLEGKFTSLYANRMDAGQGLRTGEKISRQIVAADADMVINEVGRQGPLPLGMNKDINYSFANADFMGNALEYLTSRSGIMESRSKDFTLRLLDPEKTDSERSFWQLVNIGVPIAGVVFAGIIFQYIRKRKYQS